MKFLRVAILVLCASSLAFAGDPEFHTIVKSIEHTYGVHHLRIPFLGVAMFFARPSGVHGLKLAVFEGFHPPDDTEAVRRVVERCLGPDWHPFVRVLSKGKDNGNGETTLIYTNPVGDRMRMMIVNLEPSEAVVVKMDLSDNAIEKWLKEPGEEAEGHHHHQKVKEEDKEKEREKDREHDQQMLAKE